MKQMKGVAVIVAVLVGICLYEWWPRTPPTPLAPVDLTWRPSALTGLVMQTHNTSGNHLSCLLTVVNKTHQENKQFSFSLDPYGGKEIGIMECNWAFEHGEIGNIKVEGYSQKEFTVP